MDAFVKAEVIEGKAYLTTGSAEVYRIWFASEPYPFQERLTYAEAAHYRALTRSTEPDYGPSVLGGEE